jgi:methyl-accepting chemotaxis protein
MSNENPFQKNMELWQQFSDSYTKNMFAMFEKNLEHSKAFQDQVQSAVSQAVEAQFEMIMTSLKTMQEQIGEISTNLSEAAKVQPNGKKTK